MASYKVFSPRGIGVQVYIYRKYSRGWYIPGRWSNYWLNQWDYLA